MRTIVLSLLATVGVYAMQEIECDIVSIHRAMIHGQEVYTTHSGLVNSNNWSGYVAAENLTNPVNGSVDYAAGYWIVPTLLSTKDDTYSAIWVGIDGFTNGTVEQIGTSHNWINGAQQNYAWFEMYPSGAFMIGGFPVNVGDAISVRVGYQGHGVFKLVITNWTQDVSYTVPSFYTVNTAALRSSAEWILEAPFSSSTLPLADFNTVTFNYCSAVINKIHGTINNDGWQNDEMVMEDNPSYVKAVPTELQKDGTSFKVNWENE